MKTNILVLVLIATSWGACGPSEPDAREVSAPVTKGTISVPLEKKDPFPLSGDLEDHVHTSTEYTLSNGQKLTIQNSYPKGGGQIHPYTPRGYDDPVTGQNYGYGIFWTRVVNEGGTPLSLELNFPADSLVYPHSPELHYRLFLPPDRMTRGKLPRYNYGITGLKPFLDTNFREASTRLLTIIPGEEQFFYVAMLLRVPNGPVRTGLLVKEGRLFYEVRIDNHDPVRIPCGQITLAG